MRAPRRDAILTATALILASAGALRADQEAEPGHHPDEEDAGDLPPDLIGTIETDRPVRPWELPRDTIPELDPKKRRPSEPPPRTSRSVARAPLPDRVDGMAVRETPGGRLRVIPRALLFVPRVALEVVNAPVRGALWTYDRYELGARARDIFFNDTGTVGLYPVFDLQTDYGVTAGARFIHRDIFGARERFSARASFGGIYNQQYSGNLSSGDRFGPLRLEALGEYEIDPRERFFGIGNGEEVASVPAPIDPYMDPSAVDSRFRQRVGRTAGKARLRVAGPLSVRLASGVLWKRFERPSRGDITPGTDIAEHYQVEELPGFEQGASYTYNELELRWDSRRGAEYEPESVPSTGWLIAGYGGLARGFAGLPTRYTLWGGDLQRYIRLGEAPRVLVLRAMAEELRGEDEEIPFVDLPRLGGPTLLRGYERDRFRDRARALVSAEYLFDLGGPLAAYLFTDAGRVYPTLRDLTVDEVRVGYGGGLQLHTQRSFIGRLNVASSIDGGIFFNLSLDPVYDPRARVERD